MTRHEPARSPEQLLFDAVLHPHRSLSRTGFVAVMAALGAASFALGLAFALRGAWPVFAFFGLDLVLVYLAFHLNYRSGRLIERLRLTPRTLEVQRISPSGRVSWWRFQPTWLKVELEAPEDHDCRLTLRGGGRALTVGTFLSPHERASLCASLKAALARCRCLPAPAG
jgi:uncharacterized membrane protein